MNCKICELQNVEVPYLIFESEFFRIRHSELEKNSPGYLYLEPKKHIERFIEFSTSEYIDYAKCLEIGMNWIEKNLKPKKIYLVTISEAVPHIHFHLVPRFTEEEKGFIFLEKSVTSKAIIDSHNQQAFSIIKNIFKI
jgi:diadenosine tetraphosphate (Ap4A) HIT family hydrolase